MARRTGMSSGSSSRVRRTRSRVSVPRCPSSRPGMEVSQARTVKPVPRCSVSTGPSEGSCPRRPERRAARSSWLPGQTRTGKGRSSRAAACSYSSGAPWSAMSPLTTSRSGLRCRDRRWSTVRVARRVVSSVPSRCRSLMWAIRALKASLSPGGGVVAGGPGRPGGAGSTGGRRRVRRRKGLRGSRRPCLGLRRVRAYGGRGRCRPRPGPCRSPARSSPVRPGR